MDGIRRIGRATPAALCFVAAMAAPAHGLGSFDIVINPNATLASNTDALAAFERAATRWEAFIADPITINISASLENLGSSNIIGSASSFLTSRSYDTVRNAMIADAGDELSDPDGFDDTITQSLPTFANFNALLPAGASLSGNINMNTSVAKALGFSSFGTDATIRFNTQFNFDYDNSDGVGAGLTDFETVAAHEIGHALGFTSVVDSVNRGTTNVSPRPADLYRFSNNTANDPDSVADFATFTRDLRPGVDTITDIITDEWRMSTGQTGTGFIGGDGRQASHWKDGSLTGDTIGMFDPTLAANQVFPLSIADLRALDLIGYEIVGLLPGDYDNSGTVGQSDLDLVLANWGQAVGDGESPTLLWSNPLSITGTLVGQDELARVLQSWGNTTAILNNLTQITTLTDLSESEILALIPEPASAMLLLPVGLVLVQRRHPA